MGSIPRLGRSPGVGNGSPLQYSCLENPMDGGALWAAVPRVAKSQTWPKCLSVHEMFMYFALSFLILKLCKYDNTFIGDLEIYLNGFWGLNVSVLDKWLTLLGHYKPVFHWLTMLVAFYDIDHFLYKLYCFAFTKLFWVDFSPCFCLVSSWELLPLSAFKRLLSLTHWPFWRICIPVIFLYIMYGNGKRAGDGGKFSV